MRQDEVRPEGDVIHPHPVKDHPDAPRHGDHSSFCTTTAGELGLISPVAIRIVRPYAVDVASGVEIERGVKDPDLIEAFCRAVREADIACEGD